MVDSTSGTAESNHQRAQAVLYKYKGITVLKVLLTRVSAADVFCFEDDYTSVMNKTTLELQPTFRPLLANNLFISNGCCLPPKNEALAQETRKTSQSLTIDQNFKPTITATIMCRLMQSINRKR